MRPWHVPSDEEAERLVRRLWPRAREIRHTGWTVAADMTGGAIEVVRLTSNDVPMVLLRLDLGDVLVEMALPDAQARELAAELQGAVAWVAAGGNG